MRGWLYSINEPEGKIFEGPVYASKIKEGWVDTPALIFAVTSDAPIDNEPEKRKPGRPKAVK